MKPTRSQQGRGQQSLAPRDVALLVYPGFQIQDMSGPLAAFDMAARLRPGYKCHVISLTGGAVASSSGLQVLTKKMRSSAYDTLIVSGGSVHGDPIQSSPIPAHIIKSAARRTRRLASVCTGAFILAAAGVLDGCLATTHWQHAIRLQRLFPKVKVDGDRIFIRNGSIWTSAGVTAGIDLALAMIEEDLGSDVAQEVARMLVVYYRRPGGQSQFSAMADMEPESDRIRVVLNYIREHLDEALSTDRLAAVACLSPRQFGRTFLAETGETPAKAVERLRVEVARPRVERGIEPIEAIARVVGFSDPERMRRAFIRATGHPPQGVRRMAGAGKQASIG